MEQTHFYFTWYIPYIWMRTPYAFDIACIYLVYTMYIPVCDILGIHQAYSLYILHCLYFVYTSDILYIYIVYTEYIPCNTLYIHGIYYVYVCNILITYMEYILDMSVIYNVYTWYIHSILCVYTPSGGWCCGGGQGPIPPDPLAITSPGRVITLILLHSNAHFGFLLLFMWIRRARLELKIAGKCRA